MGRGFIKWVTSELILKNGLDIKAFQKEVRATEEREMGMSKVCSWSRDTLLRHARGSYCDGIE